MYFINVFVKGGGGVCTHYIRMGRMCRQKCSIHSLSGTLEGGGEGGAHSNIS